MERRSAALNFTLRLRATLLHTLLQKIASRAYQLGHEDGAAGRTADDSRVSIDPSQVRKFL